MSWPHDVKLREKREKLIFTSYSLVKQYHMNNMLSAISQECKCDTDLMQQLST